MEVNIEIHHDIFFFLFSCYVGCPLLKCKTCYALRLRTSKKLNQLPVYNKWPALIYKPEEILRVSVFSITCVVFTSLLPGDDVFIIWIWNTSVLHILSGGKLCTLRIKTIILSSVECAWFLHIFQRSVKTSWSYKKLTVIILSEEIPTCIFQLSDETCWYMIWR